MTLATQEDIVDAEIVPDELTRQEARELTDRIRVGLSNIWNDVTEAYVRGAHLALGYESWDDYCEKEFGASHLKLPKENRAAELTSMREKGMSLRAIQSATGVSQPTIIKDTKAGAKNFSTSTIGQDGKTYPRAPEPSVSERDWPVVPEPTPEELFQRLEKVRAQNIADGISNPPRTREDREADGRAFVESLIGNAKRQTEPATPERGNGENRHTDIINGTRNDLNLIAGNYTRYVKAISKEVPRENLPQRGNEYIIQYLKESLAKITAATEAAINKLEGERK